MAYQPKSYRKFLATSVSAAMVATTFGAVVPADVQQADAAESFSDVSNDHWASESIQRLADQGIINGYPDGTYGPTEDISRGQVAELLVNAFDLEVDENAESSFEDLNDDSYSTPFAEAVAEAGFIEGRENNTEFAASRDLTREQMATILVRAFELEPVEDTEANVNDLDNAHESHKENIEILSQHGITETEDGNFRPKEAVNRAQFATFLDRALDVQEPLQISEVNALTEDGHVLEVSFNRPYTEEITSSDVRISESDSGERVGVNEVELSSDRQSAEITLYDNTSEDALPEVARLEEYDIQIGDLETTFVRPGFLDDDNDARITEVDSDEREITVSHDETESVMEVPEDMDINFHAALGQEVRVWYDQDDTVVDFEYISSEVLSGGIEVDGDEIELLNSGDTYDIADDAEMIVNYDSGDQDTFDAEEIEENLDGDQYDYAKVVLNDDGDIDRVYANNFPADEDPILVEEVDEDYILGYDGNELDLEDYVIVKDGQEISIDDIEQDDLVFFNEDIYGDGLAVVQETSENGEIDSYYENSFDFEGENYSYVTDSGYQVQYLNEDGDLEDLDRDGAEALQDGGEVTAYFNGRGELVLLRGDEGEYTTNYSGAQPTDNMVVYQDNQGNHRVEIEYVNEEGEEELKDFAADSLDEILVQTSSDEDEYETGEELPNNGFEIDEFGITGELSTDDNNSTFEEFDFTAFEDGGDGEESLFTVTEEDSLFKVSTNDDGDVEGLKFYDASAVGELDEDIEVDDDFAETTDDGSLRLNDDTVVFDTNGEEFPDADDVETYTIEELNEDGIEIDQEDTTVYFNDNEEVEQIAVGNLDAANTTDYAALIQRVDVDDDEIVRVKALVDGESKTFDVDNLDTQGLFEGSVVELEVNDSNDEVESITAEDNRTAAGIVQDVNVSDNEVTIQDSNGIESTFELNDDGEVYDATDSDGDDFSSENLRNIEEGDALAIGLSAANSRFADVFAIVNEADLEDYGYAGIGVSDVSVDNDNNNKINLTFTEDVDAGNGDIQNQFTATLGGEELNFVADENNLGDAEYSVAHDGASTVSVYVYGYDGSGDSLEIDYTSDNYFTNGDGDSVEPFSATIDADQSTSIEVYEN